MNNSYARACRAWNSRDLTGYQKLARHQTELGADYLTLNIDGTHTVSVKLWEMLEFLPELVPAIQEATSLPISFDNPSVDYHRLALECYDRSKGGTPILNSLAASRERLDEMIELVKEFDTKVIVMASEKFTEEGGAQCLNPNDAYQVTKDFVGILTDRADRTLDQIIIDPGLAPVGADTYGLVNIGLDTMRLIHKDPDLDGIHLTVGLSNFAWGIPNTVRHQLERAYLTLGVPLGLNYVLGNPERDLTPLDSDDPLVKHLQVSLEMGRPLDDETQEEAGFRQAQSIMELCQFES